MAFSLKCIVLVSLALVSCCQSKISTENVPVFMWGAVDIAVKSNPLNTISGDKVKHTLEDALQENPVVVAFFEENLSVEDFSHKDEEGTPFPYLSKQLENALYLPSVVSPVSQILELTSSGNVQKIDLTENGLSEPIKSIASNYIFINLKDAKEGESRIEMLRRHNEFMKSVFEQLEGKFDSVVGIYTAKHPSWSVPLSRHIRQANGTATANSTEAAITGNPMIFKGTNMLFYIREIAYQASGSAEVKLRDGTLKDIVENETNVTVNLDFTEHTLTLVFVSEGGYWYLRQVNITEDGQELTLNGSAVFAPLDFSYHCSQRINYQAFFGNNTISLSFGDFQIQPFFANGTSDKFGDYYDCVPFFSAPIWAGLFIVFIVLSITFYGLVGIMDIKTMDRFDDPKGKTITISAFD